MAREEGLDLAAVQGSGPERAHRQARRRGGDRPGRAGRGGGPGAAPRPVPRRLPPGVRRREPEVLPISGMRKVIAQRMAEVKPGVPHFYVTVDIDMEEAVKVREEAKAAEVKISVNDLIVKAAAMALRRQPKVNVSLQGDRILQFHTADVGIAVAIEDGLITPVIRDADQKSLGTIAAEARELAERARRKALKPEEYTGGSITVSNLGMYGVDTFIAVINPPQASIVAVGAVADRAVVRDGKVVVRKTMSRDLLRGPPGGRRRARRPVPPGAQGAARAADAAAVLDPDAWEAGLPSSPGGDSRRSPDNPKISGDFPDRGDSEARPRSPSAPCGEAGIPVVLGLAALSAPRAPPRRWTTGEGPWTGTCPCRPDGVPAVQAALRGPPVRRGARRAGGSEGAPQARARRSPRACRRRAGRCSTPGSARGRFPGRRRGW